MVDHFDLIIMNFLYNLGAPNLNSLIGDHNLIQGYYSFINYSHYCPIIGQDSFRFYSALPNFSNSGALSRPLTIHSRFSGAFPAINLTIWAR